MYQFHIFNDERICQMKLSESVFSVIGMFQRESHPIIFKTKVSTLLSIFRLQFSNALIGHVDKAFLFIIAAGLLLYPFSLRTE